MSFYTLTIFMVPKLLPVQSVIQFMQQKFIGLVVCGFLWSPSLCLVKCKSAKIHQFCSGHQTFAYSICKSIHAAKIYRFCMLWLFMVTKRLPGQSVSQFLQQKFIGLIVCGFLWSPSLFAWSNVSQQKFTGFVVAFCGHQTFAVQSVSQFTQQKFIGFGLCGFLWSPNVCLVNL